MIVNYTPEQTVQIVEAYKAEPTKATVETLAAAIGKSAASIVAKLVKEGVYVSAAKPAAKREMRKAEMVAEIATFLKVNEEVLESLEKATAPALMAVVTALRAVKAEAAEEQ